MAKIIKDDYSSSHYLDPQMYLDLITGGKKTDEELEEEEKNAFNEEEIAPSMEMYNGKPVTEKMRWELIGKIVDLTNKYSEEAKREGRQYSRPDKEQLRYESYQFLLQLYNRLANPKNDKDKQVRFIYAGNEDKPQSMKRAEVTLENIEEEEGAIEEKRKSEKDYAEYWINLLCKYLRENLPGHPIFAIEMSTDAIGRFPKKGEPEKGRIVQPAYNKLAPGSLTESTGTPRVALSGYVEKKVTEDEIKACVNDFGKKYPETGATYESGKIYNEDVSSPINPVSSKSYVESEKRRMRNYNEWIIWVRFEGEQMKNMYYTRTAANKPSDDVYAEFVREYGLRKDSKKTIPYSKFNDAFGENPLKNSRSNMFEMPNGEVVYVEYLNGQLIAGPATNAGIIPLVTIDYDEDMTVDGNLEAVYDELLELDWDYNSETGRYDDSCREATKKDAKCKDGYLYSRRDSEFHGVPGTTVNYDAVNGNHTVKYVNGGVIIVDEFELEEFFKKEFLEYMKGDEDAYTEEELDDLSNKRAQNDFDEYIQDYFNDGLKRFCQINGIKDTKNTKKSCKDADEWRFKLAKRRNSYDEYVIRAYKNGKYDEDATYYTDDWDDAVGTLTDIAQRQGLKVREEKSGFVADSLKRKATKDGNRWKHIPYDVHEYVMETVDESDKLWDIFSQADDVKYVKSVKEIPNEVDGQKIKYRFTTGKNFDINVYSDPYREKVFILKDSKKSCKDEKEPAFEINGVEVFDVDGHYEFDYAGQHWIVSTEEEAREIIED